MVDAYESGNTVAILFVHDGGIDDRLVRDASERLAGSRPASPPSSSRRAQISRYAAITEGVGVDRVPALVVVRPKRLERLDPHGLGQLRLPERARASSRP